MPDLIFISKDRREAASETVQAPVPTPEVINGLIATNVKTHIQNQSVVVAVGTEIEALFLLSNLIGWVLEGTKIIIKGLIDITLVFINKTEAEAAEIRLANALNGQLVV